MFYVYILQLRDKSLYTGYTNNLERRMKEHSTGRGSKYVRSRLPFKMAYFETYDNRSDAMRRELRIKKMSRPQKFELISA